MSWVSKGLKKLGKGVSKVGKQVGKAWEKVDDFALPAIGFALGGPGGAALGAAAARGIGDGKFNAGETLKAGVKGYALGSAGKAAGLVGGQGLKTFGSSAVNAISNPVATGSKLLGAGGSKAAGGVPNIEPLSVRSMTPSVEAAGGMVSRAASAGGGVANAASAGANPSIMGTISNAVGGVPGALELGGGLMSAYGGYKAGQQQDKAMAQQQKLSDQAMQFAVNQYNERSPYRKLGVDMAMNQTPEDLSGLFQTSSPFANRYRKVG